MAKNFMSSILDELMGRDRNALPTETPKKINWDDPDMCTLYLVCFCPHELFVNTKADLGPCTKFHDEQLRKKYLEEAPGYKKSVYETEFIRFAEKMIADIEGKIKRGKMRIALANGPDGGTYAGPGSRNAEKIALLTERINQLLEETEAAGCEGDVEKAQGLMKLCDQLKEERDQLKTAEPVSHPWNPDKAMQVCEVCGSYLIIGEAQHRLDDHIMGKQHVGFAMLRKSLEEVRNAKEARDQAERERIQKERERRFGRTSRDRDGDRRHRDRDDSRKSDRDRRSSSSRDKDRDRDRDRGDKDKDKDRRHHRSRSKDKHDRHRSKDDSERRSGRHRSKSSERKDKDKDKDSDKKDKDRDSKHRHDDKDKDRDRRHSSKSKRSRSRSTDRGRDRDRHHKRSRSEKDDHDRDRKEKEKEKQHVMEETWDAPQESAEQSVEENQQTCPATGADQEKGNEVTDDGGDLEPKEEPHKKEKQAYEAPSDPPAEEIAAQVHEDEQEQEDHLNA